MKKLAMLFSLLLLFTLSSWAQVTVTIGTGTSTGRYPLDDYYVYSRSQCLYLASEIGMGGTITKLRWYRDDTGADPNAIGTTEIWLMETTNTTLTGTAWEGPGTLVSTISNIDLGSGNGWYEIDITDFAYSGTQNLLVSVYTQDAPYTSPHSYWRYTTATDMARLGESDDENPPTLYISSSRPNIQFDFLPSTPYLTLSPSSLAFGYVAYPGSSTEQTYTISGENLTAGPVVVTAPTGFGVSLTSGGPYTSSVNVSYTPPTLATTTIFSNFSPLAANTSYNGNITNIGGGATGNVAVTGTSAVIYCTPTYIDGGTSDFITQVSLNTLSQATASNLTPFYIDYTSTQNAIPDLQAGVTANLSLTFGSDGTQYNGVWIDFNLNGLFDATEFFTSNTNAGVNGTVTINIAVPVSATLGQTRMRIRGGDDYQLTSTQACGASSSSYGQAQDFLVNITAPPTCLPPSALTATNITSSSAILGWTEMGTATLWNIELGVPGFTPGTGTSLTGITGTTSNSWTVSGGEPNTTYEFYVQADCGSGDVSAWAGPYAVTTLCDAVTTFPFTEDFADGIVPPDCWSEIITNTTGNWEYDAGGFATVLYDYSQNEWLITPVLDFSTLTNPYLSFDWAMSYYYAIDPYNNYDLICKVSTNGGATWDSIWTEAAEGVFTTWTWYTKTINLSAYAGQSNVKIAWQYLGDDGAQGSIDNILVEEVLVPSITSLGSTSGCVGSDLVINGTNLGDATSVTIGGTAATITANTETSITVSVGTGTTGTIAVTTLGGTATSTETFTVNQLPSVYTVSGGGIYCAGGTGVSIALDGSVSGVNYELSTTPVTTLAGTGSALTFGPSAFETGVYTVTAVDPITTCSVIMTGNANVTKNPTPTAVTATASSNTICEGASIDLFSSAISEETAIVNVLTEDFETSPYVPPTGWANLNGGLGNVWSTNSIGAAHGGAYAAEYKYNSANDADAWLISPGLIFTAGKIYTIKYWVNTYGYYSENLKVTIGTDQTIASQTVLEDLIGLMNSDYVEHTITYTCTTSGTYYIGWNCYSTANQYFVDIDDISVTTTAPVPPSYSWTSLPVGYTSTDQNPVGVIPPAAGSIDYIVTASSSLGCFATASTTVVVDPCTGVNENNDGISVSVVPNPSNGMFYLNVEGINETVTLNIYSINGQVIYTAQLDNTGLINKPINLKSYPKGMYFLRLINNNITHTEKIIIE